MNSKLLFLIFFTLLFANVCAFSKDLVIISSSNNDVVRNGLWYGYDEKNDSISSGVISDKGIIAMPESNLTKLEIIAHNHSPQLIVISQLKSDTIYVKPSSLLDELVVTPSKVSDLGDRLSYRIPMQDMNRYANFYQALNEIPHLTVLPGGGSYYEGDPNIIFLLNGVETSISELQTISKEDISKIDIYRNPPARFAEKRGVKVINVITKSNLTGGNIGVELNQAFYPLTGNNSASIFYNYRRSRFSLQYSGENRHFKKFRQSELLDYKFDGVSYIKNKEGKDSKDDSDDNTLLFSFQNNNQNDYLYNLKIGTEWNRSSSKLNQAVITNDATFDALNILLTKFNKFNIANYFEKRIGNPESESTILANINFQHYDTKYRSSYEEFPDLSVLNPLTSYSSYKTRLDGVFVELQYEFPKTKIGAFSCAAYDTYHYSKYVDRINPFYQRTNSVGGNVTWSGSWKNILWNAKMGVLSDYVSTSNIEKPYNVVIPSPSLYLAWKLANSFSLAFNYLYSLNIPSIAQLSETEQWLDTRLVFHGNSTLKPSKNHSFNINSALSHRYIYASLKLYYNFSPNSICNQYLLTDNYMLETIVNLDKYHELGGTLDVTLMPLGNTKLTFWNRIALADVRGDNSSYSWHGTRFQWMSVLSLNLNRWIVSAYYQYPGRIADGQLIRPRAQCWSVTAYYSPVNNLWLGLKWFMPFGKGLKDSEHTVNSAPVYWEKTTDIRDGANYVAIQLSWNFTFGKNQNRQKPQFSNSDNDAGILRK